VKGHGGTLRTAYPARVVPSDATSLQFGGVHDKWNDLGSCTRCKEVDGNLSVIVLHAPAHVPSSKCHTMESGTGLSAVSLIGLSTAVRTARNRWRTVTVLTYLVSMTQTTRVRGEPRMPCSRSLWSTETTSCRAPPSGRRQSPCLAPFLSKFPCHPSLAP
jgi:hypothetical protein